MFEKEKKQYSEDCKTHEKPWELWQYAMPTHGVLDWIDFMQHPVWSKHCIYRRKPTAFVPEYFSGLNWRVAEHLIGKTVECTNNPDCGWAVGTLKIIAHMNDTHFGMTIDNHTYFYNYIRTCEKTFQHPTINIGGVYLPIPETVAPDPGTVYWVFGTPATAKDGSLYDSSVWPQYVSKWEKESLKNGAIHLTEERAKAWADWWKSMVIDKMQ